MNRITRNFASIVGICTIGFSLLGCSGNNQMNQTSQTRVPQYDGYELIWNDEFNGDTLNTDIWNYEITRFCEEDDTQKSDTSTENVYIHNGRAVIKAIECIDENGNPYYTSGTLTTQYKEDFMYGRIMVRARVSQGQGLLSSVCLMPSEENYYGKWPRCGEIDIMEVFGNETDTAYGTLRYGDPITEQQGIATPSEGTFSSDFHEYSVEWEPGEIRWYLDGNLYYTANDWFSADYNGNERAYPAPFNQSFFTQLTLSLDDTLSETVALENAAFEIDYVRVYQKPEYDTNVTKPEQAFREPDENGNYLFNGDFSTEESLSDEKDWFFLYHYKGEATTSIQDGVLTMIPINTGSVNYSIQLVQPLIPMQTGHTYRVTFDACASEEREMIVCVSAPDLNYIRYMENTPVSLGTEWNTYSYEFTMEAESDENGRIEFQMGGVESLAEIYIDNVKIEIIE